ncbi:hypothetical protein THAOC_37431, partial [Thalassiosira oceanica]
VEHIDIKKQAQAVHVCPKLVRAHLTHFLQFFTGFKKSRLLRPASTLYISTLTSLIK